jgi:hypothetical protein
MYMVVVAMVTDHTIVMVTTHLVDLIWVVVNHLPMDRSIMPIDTNLMLHGALVAMAHSIVTVALEDAKVLSLSKSFTDK